MRNLVKAVIYWLRKDDDRHLLHVRCLLRAGQQREGGREPAPKAGATADGTGGRRGRGKAKPADALTTGAVARVLNREFVTGVQTSSSVSLTPPDETIGAVTGWACDCCTFVNVKEVMQCGMCGAYEVDGQTARNLHARYAAERKMVANREAADAEFAKAMGKRGRANEGSRGRVKGEERGEGREGGTGKGDHSSEVDTQVWVDRRASRLQNRNKVKGTLVVERSSEQDVPGRSPDAQSNLGVAPWEQGEDTEIDFLSCYK